MIHKLLKAFNSASESLRGAAELTALYASLPWVMTATPAARRDLPVLVLPGFTTGDPVTAPLRHVLDMKGYKTYGWDGGINLGFNPDTAEHLVRRLQEISAAHGHAKIAIIGHSLGGIYARELAREYPELVECVITLGSPFGMQGANTPAFLKTLYSWLNPKGDPAELTDADLHHRRLTPPPVPTTSLYSTEDGVVPWKACLNPKGGTCENIAVTSSHLGMIYHPLAVAAVLDRLAQPAANWRPFAALSYSALYGAANENDLPGNPNWRHNAQSKPYFTGKK